ncbi:TRIC cation channel family protein [Dactylosporangium salmoneum]|uniref:Glycine transporter domain-containing protein n=1 Tax=Dactylosporangium salmoneum TaxID=53361 RepID=A0ABN3GFJ0_9ACTN
MSSHSALAVLDLVGIFVFAISGALTAIQHRFDAVGIVILAEVTPLGGGERPVSPHRARSASAVGRRAGPAA